MKVAKIGLGSKVLDIPCGTGRLSLFLNRLGYDVEGGDISPVMVKKSQKKASLAGLNGIKSSVTPTPKVRRIASQALLRPL